MTGIEFASLPLRSLLRSIGTPLRLASVPTIKFCDGLLLHYQERLIARHGHVISLQDLAYQDDRDGEDTRGPY